MTTFSYCELCTADTCDVQNEDNCRSMNFHLRPAPTAKDSHFESRNKHVYRPSKAKRVLWYVANLFLLFVHCCIMCNFFKPPFLMWKISHALDLTGGWWDLKSCLNLPSLLVSQLTQSLAEFAFLTRHITETLSTFYTTYLYINILWLIIWTESLP